MASGGRGLDECRGCSSTSRRDLIHLDDIHEGGDDLGIELCP